MAHSGVNETNPRSPPAHDQVHCRPLQLLNASRPTDLRMPDTRMLTLDSRDEAVQLFGPRDAHLRMIRDALAVRLIARGDTVQIDGEADAAERAERVFEQLRQVLKTQGQVQPEDVRTMLAVVQTGNERGGPQSLGVTDGGRYLRPRTDGQARYVHAMRD